MITIPITKHGVEPGSGCDATPAVRAALLSLRGSGEPTSLIFPTGRYEFWPDRASERFLFVSNNDESLKRIPFPLFDLNDLEIDGQGSTFVFHGFLTPFAIIGSRNVTLKNLSIDWERTFHSEMEVLEVHSADSSGECVVDYRIDNARFPYSLQRGQIQFTGYDNHVRPPVTVPLGYMLEFDPMRRETAFQVYDNYAIREGYTAQQLAEDVLRISGKYALPPTPGNIAVFSGAGRYCPAVLISNSADVALEDVVVHHCGAMGILGQLTENIRLTRVQVTPSEGRMVSAIADATHFVNCRGLIEMTDCLFENQLDDPTNVHGIYARISRVAAPDTVEVELVHGQQLGIDITQAGDTVEFVASENLLTYHKAPVASVERINKRFSLITLTEPLPEQVKATDAVASLGWIPDVTIQGCTTRNNRARGFLISTGGKVLIEKNYFHNPGAAILIAGDANYWFESGKVRDVTIRDNQFDNCNFGVWGRAAIDICPEIEPENREGALYHRGILIENNQFDVFDPRLVKGCCVDGLTIRGNTARLSTKYPSPKTSHPPIDITHSRNVVIEDNDFTALES